MTSTQRVQEWPSYNIPKRTRSTVPSLLEDSVRDDSEWLPVRVDDMPLAPRPLAEGQSHFNWDVARAKVRKDDLTEEDQAKFDAVRKVSHTLVDFNFFPQEPQEQPAEHLSVLGATNQPSLPEIMIPLPKEIKKSIVEARKHRSTKLPLLPPLVRRGYRIPRDDWAMLGAVRCPDRIFDTYTSTKWSARGVSQLEDPKAPSLASLHQEVAQSRPLDRSRWHTRWPQWPHALLLLLE